MFSNIYGRRINNISSILIYIILKLNCGHENSIFFVKSEFKIIYTKGTSYYELFKMKYRLLHEGFIVSIFELIY